MFFLEKCATQIKHLKMKQGIKGKDSNEEISFIGQCFFCFLSV